MNCKQCKKEYTPKLKAHNSLFCSTKCRGKASYQARKEYHKEYRDKKWDSYAKCACLKPYIRQRNFIKKVDKIFNI